MPGDETTQIDMVLRSMETARSALDDAVRKLNAGGRPEEIASLAASLSRAQTLVTTEMRRIEDARRIERDQDGLDIDSARLEIGRRLDRILAAAETGGVS
ncbi:MAG: hypothetical protein AAGF30_01105 [Pseudomonadota bacterium]